MIERRSNAVMFPSASIIDRIRNRMKTAAYSGRQRQFCVALLAALTLALRPAGRVCAQEPAPVRPPAPRIRAEVEAVLAKAPAVDADAAGQPLHVLLVAGPNDPGPGEHDDPAWQKTWASLLAKGPGVRVTTAFPWPEPAQWEGVDVVVFYFRGRWDARQLAEIQEHQARGGGVVSVHWAIGCDQDGNKHSEHFGWPYPNKSYRHGPTELRLVKPEHPVLIGLPRSMPFVDEPYWPFIGNRSRVTVLATSDEKINQGDDRRRDPGDGTVEQVPVFWTYEPP